jgi:uncharacterized protein (DUF2141 family)
MSGTSGTSIQGRVLQEPGGQPIRKVNIELTENRGFKYSATTDSEGRFKIDDLKPGRYAVVIQHPRFVQRGGKRSISIALLPGQGTTDFTFHMQPAAVITGKIFDVEGDTMSGVFVIAHPVGSVSRGMSLREWFGAGTNDLGEFRIPSLRAGSYMIEAKPEHHLRQPHPGEKGRAKEQEIYVTTYYPGTLDKEQSVTVEVHAGNETPINFGLLKSRAYRVTGTVVAAPGAGGRPIAIMLAGKARDGLVPGQIGDGGRFEFQDLLPGSYTAGLLFLTGVPNGALPGTQKMLASQPIEVSDRDVKGLQVQPDLGETVRGKLRMDTGQKLDWTQFMVYLIPIDEPDPLIMQFRPHEMPPRVSLDGAFELKRVPAGNYRLMVGSGSNNSYDYFTKSVNLDGRDVADSGFAVSPGMSLDVVVSANGSTIEGTVTDSKGKPAAYTTVLVIPRVEHRARRELYRQDTTDEHGYFSFSGLNPGKYQIFAFEELPGFEDDIRKPNFLTPYEDRAEEVQVEEGARRSLALKVIPADAD